MGSIPYRFTSPSAATSSRWRRTRAELAGFDGVAWGEHLFFHGATPNSFVTLAAADGAVTTIRLLSSVVVLPLYPAALAAKLATALDQVSGGRYDLGVGVGGEYPSEFIAAGADVSRRGRRTDELLRIMKQLWTGGVVDVDGPFDRIPAQRLQTLPLQAGGPPIWMGGRRDVAIRRAGRSADVWFPHMYSPEQLADSLVRVRREAEAAGRDPDALRGAIFCWGGVDSVARRSLRGVVAGVGETYQQEFESMADRYLLHGDPDTVTARIGEYAEARSETVVFSPVGDGARRNEIAQTFAQEVLPRVRM